MESIFDQFLLGHWHNRAQAQSNPSLFAQTEIIWAKEGEWYTSKNFYRVDGPHKPYRNKKHKIQVASKSYIIMQNYKLDGTRHQECDMHFTYQNDYWSGKLDSTRCKGEKGYRIESMINLYGEKLFSRDRGLNQKGEKVWGSDEIYKFVRI
tara:strand:- start:23107 stop:23559 length:453 start_codon:yes stop_codon:yes gene_type:complete